MKNKIIKSTIILSVSSIFAKFLGVFFRWPLVMLMGDEGIGYYQMSYPLYMFFIGMVSGMPIAISKLISEKVAYNDKKSILEIISASLKIMITLGLGTSIILSVFSKFIIDFLKWDYKVYWSLIGVSIAPVSVCVLAVFRGVFQGMENMIPTGVSQIIEQIGRVLFGVSLAFLLFPMGIEYAAGGASIGASIGGILATVFIVLIYCIFRKKYFRGIRKNIKLNSNIYISKILKIAIPLSLGATVSTIMVLIDSILVPRMLLNAGYGYKEATILYGQLTGKVSVLINVPLTLSISLCTSIVPALSQLFVLKKREQFKEKVIVSLKLSSYIAFPCFVGLYFLASPIMNVIFPQNSEGFDILKYASITIPFIIFSQVCTSILQSTNNYIKPIINLLIGCVLKIIITFILTGNPVFNIYGAILGTLFSYILTSYLNIRTIKTKLDINVSLIEVIIAPLLSSLLMIICVLISFNYLYSILGSLTLTLGASIIIGGVVYILCIIIFKRKEVKNIFISIK